MITQEQLKELLHYCPETGVWTWVVGGRRRRKGFEAGCEIMKRSGKNYRKIKVLGFMQFAHRLAFLYMTGEFPENEVDHIDGNGLNNRWDNLRAVTHAENGKNQRLNTCNTSGTTGVSWIKSRSKWLATIKVNRVNKYLGVFNSKEDAIAARKKAEAELGFHTNHGTDRPL